MKRIAIGVAIVALVAGVALAQCPVVDTSGDTLAQAGPRGMGRGQGPMQGPQQMHMMETMMPGGMTALAVYEGNIYVLDGNMLRQFTADMTEVKAIELDIECYGPMQGPGAGMGQQGAGMRQGMRGGSMQGQRPRQGMQAGQGRHMGGMMQGRPGAGMQGMMGGCAGLQLEADSTGVYLLHHGTLTRYDHNLNRAMSKDIIERPKMLRQGIREGEEPRQWMPGQGRHMGGMGQGRGGQHAPIAQRRSIDDGEVTLGYFPTDLTTGPVDLRVHVLNIDGEYDEDATVSAFLYPEGRAEIGKTLDLQSHRDGRFLGMTTIPTAGAWELGVRVSRAGEEDAKVYFQLEVSH